MKIKFILFIVIFFLSITIPSQIFALYRPQLIVAAKQKEYQDIVSKYSPESQKKLTDLNNQIIEINRRRCGEMEANIAIQSEILDEYQSRNNYQTNDKIDKARYWLTYAHEAVAFQIAKVYIFNLTSENNIKPDAQATVNLFESDLNGLRKKVLNSQSIIQDLVK